MTHFYFDKQQFITSQAVPAPTIETPKVPPVLDWGIVGAFAVIAARQLWDYFKSSESVDRAERDKILNSVIDRNILLSDHLIRMNETLVSELVSLKK